ncbi:hypothetical protein FOG50_00802 [Hanseniaspora uvarum]|uniref:Bifunctional protein RIB2 n=1 Tax=Hanseniaspora uvarum TaxID=29833 RepID=A0A1E5R494_HANUV|nr:hypothetical protein FOG50_00802 [Hanseniaspora uvarum]OEJ81700.1 Bifunctional protein RIB2 [Hanseniaspora uvarum]
MFHRGIRRFAYTMENNASTNGPLKKKFKIEKTVDKQGFRTTTNKATNQEPEQIVYTIDDQYRKVEPYYFTYKTYCKERWRNTNIHELLTTEFRARKPEDYARAIDEGKVLVNENPIDRTYIIKNGDLLQHTTHTHEPKVNNKPIKIVYQDEEMIVIDKPSSIPAHPTGRYRFNTVTKILEREMNILAHPINRLDRLTSGLMFLSKNPKKANEMRISLFQREFSKQYMARVVGEFPLTLENESIKVDKPIGVYNPRVTLNIIDEENGKPSQTEFKRISYDKESNTSIVLCKPLTGRTHQIRLHLQYLGYPIANDPLYSSPKLWGPKIAKNAEYENSLDDICKNLEEVGKTTVSTNWWCENNNINKDEGERFTGKHCEVCGGDIHEDPRKDELELWLHAYKYESLKNEDPTKNWSYSTDLPDWCTNVHAKYMEMALEEADKCEATDKAFNVGCVITHDNEVLSLGFSRELEGNTHAEQNALQKLKDKNIEIPKGADLYTTMEPCSERLSGNLPCVDRIIEHKDKIETVFIGCAEPQTFIQDNTSIKKLIDSGINYVILPGFKERAEKIAFKGHLK